MLFTSTIKTVPGHESILLTILNLLDIQVYDIHKNKTLNLSNKAWIKAFRLSQKIDSREITLPNMDMRKHVITSIYQELVIY